MTEEELNEIEARANAEIEKRYGHLLGHWENINLFFEEDFPKLIAMRRLQEENERLYEFYIATLKSIVEAKNEAEAYEIAYDELNQLSAYVGNGGLDKLIGVDGENDSVNADDEIIYDDIELLPEPEEENV